MSTRQENRLRTLATLENWVIRAATSLEKSRKTRDKREANWQLFVAIRCLEISAQIVHLRAKIQRVALAPAGEERAG